jgi:hypothetical protein
MNQVIEYNINLGIEQNEPVKFEYLQHMFHNINETIMNKSEIDQLYHIFQACPDYCWELFTTPPEIIIHVSNIILQWYIKVKFSDKNPLTDQQIELPDENYNSCKITIVQNILDLQQILQKCNERFSDFDFAVQHDKYMQQFYNLFKNKIVPIYPTTVASQNMNYLLTDEKIESSNVDPNVGTLLINEKIESSNVDPNVGTLLINEKINLRKITIIENIWDLHQILQICGNRNFINYFTDLDFADRNDKYVQQFYNILAMGDFNGVQSLIPVFKVLDDKIDPNYPIMTIPIDIIPNVGPDTLFTRMVHYMMQVIAEHNTRNNYQNNVCCVYNHVRSYLVVLNIWINKADLTKLLCGTSMKYPEVGSVKQLVDRWFEPMIRYVNTYPQSNENRQTIETLKKLRTATWL